MWEGGYEEDSGQQKSKKTGLKVTQGDHFRVEKCRTGGICFVQVENGEHVGSISTVIKNTMHD